MTKFVFIDVEACGGKTPARGVMTEFAAIELESYKTFHGKLWDASPHPDNPAMSYIADGAKHYDEEKIMRRFAHWCDEFGERLVFISDNIAYDWQWIAFYHEKHLGDTGHLGHSGRRISDIYSGLSGNWKSTQKWKKWRITPHDHNPVNDVMGNIEAFKRMMEEFEQEI